nr:MAG TPA: hypothetical protein [Caudoviricetes sp.]
MARDVGTRPGTGGQTGPGASLVVSPRGWAPPTPRRPGSAAAPPVGPWARSPLAPRGAPCFRRQRRLRRSRALLVATPYPLSPRRLFWRLPRARLAP